MKKGCFVKIIVILTILIAVILYVLENKFNELVIKPRQKIVTDFSRKKISENLQFVKDSQEKDSLISFAGTFFLEGISGADMDSAEQILQNILRDSIITFAELQEFKSFLK